MFEGWATEYLASYLGHFCDLQKDQLRISLWRAWRTGFSLENVSLRADAFDYLQLPFKLLSGRIGRVQAQVPWHALRSAPVVIELCDVHLCLGLLDESDLAAQPAGERAWAAKQAQLAVAELQAEAAAASGAGGPGAGGEGPRGGEGKHGMLWSFLQHLVTMLLNKLQLRVRNVHISLRDLSTGSVAGVKLVELRTCSLSEAEHLSLLVEDPLAGAFFPGGLGAAPRGTIHKQLAVQELSAYWAPGQGSQAGAGTVPLGEAAAHGAVAPPPDQLHPLLLPLDLTLQMATQVPGSEADRAPAVAEPGEGAPGSEGLRVHAVAVLHSLQLSLHHGQAADILRLADGAAWLAARNACAAFRPAAGHGGGQGLGSIGSRRQMCRQMWQFAVNAVLMQRRGQRDGVRWVDASTRRRLRLQYIRTYCGHLEAQPPHQRVALKAAPAQQQPQEGGGAGGARAPGLPPAAPPVSQVGASSAGADDAGMAQQLQALERQLTVADIVLCRQAARQRWLACSNPALPAAAVGQVTPTKRPRASQDFAGPQPPSRPSSPTPLPSPTTMHQSVSAPGSPADAGTGAVDGGGRARRARARSGAASDSDSKAAAGSQKGYISWGLSKVAGLLGYMPPAQGSSMGLLEPSESDVRQLYEAVDFDPEREADMKPSPRSVQVTLDCLISRASLVLRQPPSPLPSPGPPPLNTAREDGAQGTVNTAAGSGGWAQGSSIAAVELERIQLDFQMLPQGATASVVVADAEAHDLVAHGPGVTELMLGRLESSHHSLHHHHHHHHEPVPIIRLKLQWPSSPPPPLPADTAALGFPPPPHPHPPQQQHQQPTLDVLVQPLLLHYRPACLRQLQLVLPAALAGTFHEHLMAAVNGLSSEARAAEKAAYLQYLGPAIDVLVKVLDMHLQLGAADGAPTSSGAVLSTGPITFHTLRQHLQLSPGAALELLQWRREGRVGGAAAVATAGAAVVAVEQQLVYQHFDFTVGAVQLVALHTELPGSVVGDAPWSLRGSSGGRHGGDTGEAAEGSSGGRRLVLQPLKLQGSLKLNRITDDTALTQAHCSLQIDPITLSLTPALAVHLAALLAPPPQHAGASSAGEAQNAGSSSPQDADAPHRSPSAAFLPGWAPPEGTGRAPWRSSTAPGDAAASPAKAMARNNMAEGLQRQQSPAVMLDVRLSSLDASYFVPGGRAGKVEAHAHLSLLRAGAALQVFPAGVQSQVSVSGLSFRDLSPEIYSLLPVKAAIPHLAKACSLESVQVSFDGTAHGSGGGSTTEVQLQDLVLHGYAGETGNFIARLHERRPTLGTITVHNTPSSLHTTVTLNNLLVGHAFIMRIVALLLPGEDEEGAGSDAGAPTAPPGAATQGMADAASMTSTPEAGFGPPAGPTLAVVSGGRDELGSELADAPPATPAHDGSAQADPTQAPEGAAAVAALGGREGDAHAAAAAGEGAEGQAHEPAGAAAASSAQPPIAPGDSPDAAALLPADEPTPTQQPEPEPEPPSQPSPLAPDPATPPPVLAYASSAPQAKPAITIVQLLGCRVVCKYRRGTSSSPGLVAHAARAGGAFHSAAAAAALEALELHEDILHLDIPSLCLQLPLEPLPPQPHPASMPDQNHSREQLQPQLGHGASEEAQEGQGSAVGGSDAGSTAAAAFGFVSPTRSPSRLLRHSTSGHSMYTSASSTDLRGDASSLEGCPRWPMLRSLPPQTLLSAAGLSLSLAAVGYSGRAMLPVLSVPSVQLLAWHSVPSAPGADHGSAARNLAGKLEAVAAQESVQGSAAHLRTSGDSSGSGMGAEPASVENAVGGAWVTRYSLAVNSLDLGAHPSNVTVAGLLLQQCQNEMALLMRDTSDLTTTEVESAISSNSSPHTLPPQVTRGQAASASASHQEAASQPAGKLWQVDARVALIGVSLLGSTQSSSCVKLEWRELRCSASNSHLGAGSRGAGGTTGPQLPLLLAGQVSWQEVAVHALVPHVMQPSASFATPFAAAAAMFGSRSNGGSGLFDPGASDLLYHWSMGKEPTANQGARRNLSSGLGAPVAAARTPEEPELAFHEAASQMLARRSGSSGISRYFSAADSDFEDAASDFEGASSPGGGSPRHPSPLPLDLSCPGYEALPLLRIVACPEGNASADVKAGSADQLPAVVLSFDHWQLQELRGSQEAQHDWGLTVAPVALQAHMSGWQDALQCLLSYAPRAKEVAAVIQAAGSHPHTLQRPTTVPHPAPTAPAASGPARAATHAPGRAPASAAQQLPVQQGPALGVRVVLRRLVVVAVADMVAPPDPLADEELAEESQQDGEEALGGADSVSLVPACSLTSAVTVLCRVDADGGLHVAVEVPMVLLGVGMVPRQHAVPAALALPLQDSMLGMNQAELSVVMNPPAPPPGPLPPVVVAEAALHSPPHTSIAANVQQVSVWASQRNLCMLAAIAQHAQQLAVQLARLGAPDGEADKAQAVVAAGPGALLTMKLNLHQLAILLSLAQHPGGMHQSSHPVLHQVPLYELAATAVTADVHDVGVGWLEATVATHLQLDVFSSSKQGWEPLLEPWQCRLEVVTPTTPGAHHQHLGIVSQQGLELTITETAAEAAGRFADAFKSIPAVFEQPGSLEGALSAAGGTGSSLSAAWWLHNLTGSVLELWVVSPAEARAAQALAGPPMVTAAPGSKVDLPVFAHGNTHHQQRHAGRPCVVTGVSQCCDDARCKAGTSLDAKLDSQQSHRMLLYFRLAEQSLPCGPVHLDRLEPSEHEVHPAEMADLPLRAKVVCELQEGRCGGSTVTLHSGVQVHNNTELPVDVGVQTPMGLVMEPQSLGVVQPRASFWLPVLRAEAGLLCVRPSAGAVHALHVTMAQPAGNGTATASASLAAGGPDAGRGAGLSSPLPRVGLQAAHAPGSAPFPPPHPGLLYASGRLSPARLSIDRHLLQQLEASAQHAAQLCGGGSGHGGHAEYPAAVQAHQHEWSNAVALQQLLRSSEGGEAGAGPSLSDALLRPKTLYCHSTAGDEVPLIFSMGSSASGADGLVRHVTVNPPLLLHNALPVPVDVTLKAWMKNHLVSLRPNQQVGIHQLEAAHVESLAFKALGYQPTAPIVPNPIAASASGGHEVVGPGAAIGPAGDASRGTGESHAPQTLVQLDELGHGHSRVQVSLQHSLNSNTGCHTVRLGCTLWVYNLTGLPISLRQSVDDPLVLRDAELKLEEDVVPASWVPPLSLNKPPQPMQQHLPSGGSSAGSTPLQPRLSSPLLQLSGLRSMSREGMRSMHSFPNLLSPTGPGTAPGTPGSYTTASRAASTIDMPGLGEILAEEGDRRQMHGLKRTVSRARGIADSMEVTPMFETPSRWPSMHGGMLHHRHRLRIQVRATQCKAPEGRTFWSDSVELDATVGGAAVVTAPSPLLPPAGALPAPKAAYMMSVTATQVPGSAGALALYLLPRYLLHNALDMPIQYKQQGTGFERELQAGAARPLRTADASRALRLCVRVQEAGWLWSGGVALDTPGDLFIKIRHRDRGVTMLVRVDVAASASGVLVVTLSHHPSGFAPYRIENCTLETLHARQHRCKEQQDVLRPYCALNYAWDEPALPHKLVLELPGSRFLGTFLLDKVGQDVVVPVPTRKGEPERQVRVLVRAEGPTRVLTVVDLLRHQLPAEVQPAPAGGSAWAWPCQRRSGSEGATGAGEVAGAAGPRGTGAPPPSRAVPSGLLWEVNADLVSVGLSLTSPSQELCYLRAGNLRTTVAVSAARFVVDLEVKTLQVDNPSRWVAHPVTLVLPAPASRFTTTIAAAKLDKQRKPAITLQLAVWQRRPAGVVCVEHADLQVAPLGIFIEQQHAIQLADFLSTLSASFLPPSAAASGAAALPPRSSSFPGEGWAAGGSRAVSVNGDAASQAVAGALVAALPCVEGGLQLQLPPDLLALLSGQGHGGGAQGQKVYIDIMRVGALDITISFLPAPWDLSGRPRVQALQRLLSLADVEDAHLKLAGLELRHPLMGTAALAQHLQRHYMKAVLPELYKVVGAANMFGDPVRLVHHLGLGVWSFLASPAAGLVESARQRGPRQFLAGLVSGTQELFANVVFAFSNAATKGSGAARKFIVVLGLDRYNHNWATATFRQRIRFDDGAALALPLRRRPATAGGGAEGGVLGAVLRGIVGVISEPIRGADEGGLAGFMHGVKRGVLGFVVIPLASLLETSARMADSIRRAVAGASSISWVRPPRYVAPGEPLPPYDWYEAMGRWLLAELHRSQHDGAAQPQEEEALVLCVPAATKGHYLVATDAKVLYIHARDPMWMPLVKWSAALADLELIARQHSTLSMMAQHAERTHFMRSMWDHLSDARAKPRGPWSFQAVECQGEEGAVRFEAWVREMMQRPGQRRMTLVGHAQMLTLR